MKINNKFKNNLLIIVTIIIIGAYHYHIQNGIEKIFYETYFDYNNGDDIKVEYENKFYLCSVVNGELEKIKQI